MALKSGVRFQIKIVGDGSDKTVSIPLATAPIVFVPPSSDGDFSTGFSISSLLPSDVISVSCPGHTIDSATLSGFNTVLNITTGDALGVGEEGVLQGTFIF